MSAAVLDAIATAAELQPADLVAAAAVGRPPRITGVLISDLLRLGDGAALVADLRGRVTAEPSPDLDDPDVIVLLTYAEAVALCRPEDTATPRMRPPVLATKLTDRYAAEHEALVLAVAA